MSFIRKRRNEYLILFAFSICLAVLMGLVFMSEAIYIFGAISLISFILLVRQHRLLNDATLIWENKILAVPSALISMTGQHMKKNTGETLLSTFGIIIGREIYRWGLNGIHGVRLHSVHIDPEKIHLTFGDANETMQLELLHGITDKQNVVSAAKKILYETGVMAEISGW